MKVSIALNYLLFQSIMSAFQKQKPQIKVQEKYSNLWSSLKQNKTKKSTTLLENNYWLSKILLIILKHFLLLEGIIGLCIPSLKDLLLKIKIWKH